MWSCRPKVLTQCRRDRCPISQSKITELIGIFERRPSSGRTGLSIGFGIPVSIRPACSEQFFSNCASPGQRDAHAALLAGYQHPGDAISAPPTASVKRWTLCPWASDELSLDWCLIRRVRVLRGACDFAWSAIRRSTPGAPLPLSGKQQSAYPNMKSHAGETARLQLAGRWNESKKGCSNVALDPAGGSCPGGCAGLAL
jgi:hypothetical protein